MAKKVPGGTRKEKLKEEKRCESEGKKASKGQKNKTVGVCARGRSGGRMK